MTESFGYARLLNPGETVDEAKAKLLAALAPTQQVIEGKVKAKTPCAKEQQRGPFKCVACNGAGETVVWSRRTSSHESLFIPPHFEPCVPCGGKGKVMFTEPCGQCGGTGEKKHPHHGKKVKWVGPPKFTVTKRPPLHAAPDGGPLHSPPCGDCLERTKITVSRNYAVTP